MRRRNDRVQLRRRHQSDRQGAEGDNINIMPPAQCPSAVSSHGVQYRQRHGTLRWKEGQIWHVPPCIHSSTRSMPLMYVERGRSSSSPVSTRAPLPTALELTTAVALWWRATRSSCRRAL